MKKFWLTGVICLLFWGMMPCGGMEHVRAEGAEAYFGTSEGYIWDLGEISHIGFYMAGIADERLEHVRLLVEYDPRILELNSTEDEGVTIVDDGKFILERTGNLGRVYKQIIYFKPLVSADTAIEILSAEGDTDAGTISIDTEVYTTVAVPLEPGCRLSGIYIDGTEIEGFDPRRMSYDISVTGETVSPKITAQADDGTEVEISDYDQLAVGRNTIYITTTNREGQKGLYTLNIDMEQVLTEEPSAEQPLSEQAVGQNDGTDNSVAHVDSEENSLSAEDNVKVVEPVYTPNPDESSRKRQIADQVLKGMLIFICLLIVVEVVLLIVKRLSNNDGKRKAPSQERVKSRAKKITTSGLPPIVIQAEHVCMDFDRAVNEYTSVKELIIQTIKGERIKEKYRALDDISFSIRKGKVIGVIGTNGAGKSTLLKVISGALRPSSGVMRVNRNKIQILTLGTGFDMELTGKENVYLNGAIIGYDKKFIDEHYEEIVEFAELQDFMNEKVKNYSSGMVSRLGFAIATVGEPPEILILDEVLSVGDQIFQKKSLRRIKELIHSGSTVLMVSHSTNTIKGNCDKAIWLEKGHLIAMGNAKDICDMYDKYDGNFEKLMVRRREELDTLEWIG